MAAMLGKRGGEFYPLRRKPRLSRRVRGIAATSNSGQEPATGLRYRPARNARTARMTLPPPIATFYTRPGPMTDPGALEALLKDAPSDIPGIVAYTQNLLLHQHWAPAYRMRLTAARLEEPHTRSVHDMLVLLQRHDPRPLAFARTLYQRAVGNCRHFSTFGTALFRRACIPARARCGFGAYFQQGFHADHWVIEYWNGAAWQLLDAQIDAAQRAMLRLDFDPLDVPRDQFVIAFDAWQKCRAGTADPATFGIFQEKGMWFIAGNVVRDFAALNNMEMLPWDVWGAMVKPDEEFTPQKLALFDRLATLCADPDAHFDKLRKLYASDAALRVPAQVFNALRQRME
ncbi:MAG TPA: transglutaminase domain-containing protein, partial [Rhizomicrobium sp.]|nr:transglutaminase domain-containing protein [Rhizomicrobium sp.]